MDEETRIALETLDEKLVKTHNKVLIVEIMLIFVIIVAFAIGFALQQDHRKILSEINKVSCETIDKN